MIDINCVDQGCNTIIGDYGYLHDVKQLILIFVATSNINLLKIIFIDIIHNIKKLMLLAIISIKSCWLWQLLAL